MTGSDAGLFTSSTLESSPLEARAGDVAAAIDLAVSSLEPAPLEAGHRYVVLVPPGSAPQLLDTRPLDPDVDPRPARKRGTVRLDTAAAFALYVNTHKGKPTALYASVDACRVVAVLNDHDPGDDPTGAGWGDHRALLALKHTPEWKRWADRDGKLMDQQAFAELIEDARREIVGPLDAADMLEMAQTFEATIGADFRQATRLASGQRQITYNETIDARAGKSGNLTIPERFTLRLAVFEGGKPVEFEARLRYRITEGRLALGFVLDDPAQLKRDAFESIVGEIIDATSLTPYAGVYDAG